MLLVDASVWVAAGWPADRWHEAAGTLIREPTGPLSALDLTLHEVANTVGVQFGQPEEARRLYRLIINRCGNRLTRVDADLFETTIEIANEHGISAYDAAYVAVARRDALTLVSVDFRDLVSKGLAVAPDAAGYP